MSRRWIDRADPKPSSSLIYQTFDGRDTVLRLEMATGQPGSMITLELFPAQPFAAVVISGEEAIALGRRLLRMGEKSSILGTA